jgi:nucleotide-binding universal stress UspA family protein
MTSPKSSQSIPIHVFHPSDYSEGDKPAVAHALKIAASAHGSLTVMHVDNRPSQNQISVVRPLLARWREARISDDSVRVTRVNRIGPVLRKIVEHLENHADDLVVLSTHQRHGVARWIQPGLSEPILRQSRVSTLFVPRGVEGFVSIRSGAVKLRKVLFPVDIKPHPQNALRFLAKLLEALQFPKVEVQLVHFGDKSTVPALNLPEIPSASFKWLDGAGDVVRGILSLARSQKSDLIVMTTEGHLGFLDAIRGSTTERIIRNAPCPVLAVPAGIK